MGMQTGSVNLGSAHGSVILSTNVADAMRQARREFSAGLNGMAQTLQQQGQAISNFGAQMTAFTAPLTAAMGLGVRSLGTYDELLTEIRGRTGLAGDDLARIGQFAVAEGARTVFSTEQVLSAFLQMLTAGASVEDAFAALPSTLDAAAAANMDLGRAADYVTNILSIYQLEMEDAAGVSDALARAAGSSPSSMGELAEAMQIAGPLAKEMGINYEETAAILAIFAQNGKRGSEAGTQLKSMLLNMQRPSEDVAAAWGRLGVSLYDAEGNARNLDTVMAEMNVAMADMSDQERVATLTALGGSYGIIGLSALAGSDGIEAMLDTMDAQNGVAEIAAVRMQSLNQKFNSLKGSVEAFLITALLPQADAMKGFLDQMIAAVNAGTAWAEQNPQLTTQMVQLVAVLTAAGPTLFAVGKAVQMVGMVMAVAANPIVWVAAALGALYLAYQNNVMGLADLVASLGGFQGILASARAALEPLVALLQAVFLTALGAAVAFVTDTVLPQLQGLATFLEELWVIVQPGLMGLADFFMSVLTMAVNVSINLILPMLMWFVAFLVGIWEVVAPTLGLLIKWFAEELVWAVDFINTTIMPLLQAFVDFLINLWTQTEPGLTAFKEGFLAALTWVRDNVINPAIGWIDNLMNTIQALLDKFQALHEATATVQDAMAMGGAIDNARQENNIGGWQFTKIAAGTVRDQFMSNFRDDGGVGEAMQTYAIGRNAGVEAFVTPQVRGEFIANIDKLLAQVADNNGGGGVQIGNLTIHADTEAGGRAAARGLHDELVRMGLA
jgi:TP901 family phage tail tape measure protein